MIIQPPDFSGSGFTEITPLPPAPAQPASPLLSQEEALRATASSEPAAGAITPPPLQPVTLQTGDDLPAAPPAATTLATLTPWIIANLALIIMVLAAFAWFRWMLTPARQLLILQTIAYRIVGRRKLALAALSAASGIDPAILLTSPGAMQSAIASSAPNLDIPAANDLARRAFNQTLIETKPTSASLPPSTKKSLKPGTPGAPPLTLRKPMIPRKMGIAGGVSTAQPQSRGGSDGRANGSSPRK